MDVTPAQIHAGQAIYARGMLSVTIGSFWSSPNPWIWKCPTPRLLAHYDRHVSANHLDVGVGAGYFLDRCRFPAPAPRVTGRRSMSVTCWRRFPSRARPSMVEVVGCAALFSARR